MLSGLQGFRSFLQATYFSGMGELHLDTTVDCIKREHSVHARVNGVSGVFGLQGLEGLEGALRVLGLLGSLGASGL